MAPGPGRRTSRRDSPALSSPCVAANLPEVNRRRCSHRRSAPPRPTWHCLGGRAARSVFGLADQGDPLPHPIAIYPVERCLLEPSLSTWCPCTHPLGQRLSTPPLTEPMPAHQCGEVEWFTAELAAGGARGPWVTLSRDQGRWASPIFQHPFQILPPSRALLTFPQRYRQLDQIDGPHSDTENALI